VRHVSRLVLLPSPLLGSAVWEPVAIALDNRGWPASAVDFAGARLNSPGDVTQAYLRALPADEDLVLVPHSNAGLYAAVLASERRMSAVVFVDAGIPRTDGNPSPTVPGDFYRFVAAKADAGGMLPVWMEWWDEADRTVLFPDAQVRARVERQQRRLPLSYFQDSVPAPQGWDALPCAYLAFGRTYESELDHARSLGWPVHRLDGEHLEMVVHPEEVAETIIALLGTMTRT
jgi:hypothetical protein